MVYVGPIHVVLRPFPFQILVEFRKPYLSILLINPLAEPIVFAWIHCVPLLTAMQLLYPGNMPLGYEALHEVLRPVISVVWQIKDLTDVLYPPKS